MLLGRHMKTRGGLVTDGRRVCEDRARILKQNSQYQVKLSQLSQFGGSQAKVRWSDVMGSGEGQKDDYINT